VSVLFRQEFDLRSSSYQLPFFSFVALAYVWSEEVNGRECRTKQYCVVCSIFVQFVRQTDLRSTGFDQVQVSKVVLVQLFDRQEIAALVPDRQVS
jgi:hypothetical protein